MKRLHDKVVSPSRQPAKRPKTVIQQNKSTYTNIKCIPYEIWEQVVGLALPSSDEKRVIYGELQAWASIIPLMLCCQTISDVMADLVYGSSTVPFVFSENSQNTLPMFLLSLRPRTAAKLTAVHIMNPGLGYLNIGLDLLTKCTSLRSLVLTGYSPSTKFYPLLRCFRLNKLEVPSLSRRLKEIKEEVLSNKPVTPRQLLRIQKDNVTKVCPSIDIVIPRS